MGRTEEIIETRPARSCCKSPSDECAQHPVDCLNCLNDGVCQQKATMQAHPRLIKSCGHFAPVPGWKPKSKKQGSLDAYGAGR